MQYIVFSIISSKFYSYFILWLENCKGIVSLFELCSSLVFNKVSTSEYINLYNIYIYIYTYIYIYVCILIALIKLISNVIRLIYSEWLYAFAKVYLE